MDRQTGKTYKTNKGKEYTMNPWMFKATKDGNINQQLFQLKPLMCVFAREERERKKEQWDKLPLMRSIPRKQLKVRGHQHNILEWVVMEWSLRFWCTHLFFSCTFLYVCTYYLEVGRMSTRYNPQAQKFQNKMTN